MFTIKSTAPGGLVLGHYGTFDSLDTAQDTAAKVARIAGQDFGSVNTYTAVPAAAGITPRPLHPRYLD